MKRILITGANSYIGTSFENWVKQWPDQYEVDTVDMIDGSWRTKDFSGYDVVFHVAGIAHIKETKSNKELYFTINRDLAYDTAKKAKLEKVKQFIFLSSMSVYGLSNEVITDNILLIPDSNYGRSKLQAEELILPLSDANFKTVLLRPPMVYGKGCKGNYSRLSKLAKTFPVFPDIENKRSMLYIKNLCEFIRLLINNEEIGVFHPQNKEYIVTSNLVKEIAFVHGKNIYMTKLFNFLLNNRKLKNRFISKIFGNLVYNKDLSNYKNFEYCIYDFKQSVLETEIEV